MTAVRELPTHALRTPRRRLVLLGVEGLVVLLSSIVMWVGVASGAYEEFAPLSAFILFGGVWLYWGLGVVIVVRVDGHRVGWLFALGTTLLSATFACWSMASIIGQMEVPDLEASWFYFLGALLFSPAIILILPAVAMVFPTGSLPGPRWRWSVAIVSILFVVETVALLVTMTVFNLQEGSRPPPMPVSVDVIAPIVEALVALGSLAIPVAAIVGVAAVIVRFRRSRGEQRQQLKWFVAAFIPAAILLPLSLTDVVTTLPIVSFASTLAFPIAALAIGIAITRYRLYEIDRIVSRTIAYLVVTAVLVAVVGIVILILQSLISGAVAAPGTELDPLVVAASTLVVAALFNPLRRRVQASVDHRFNRAHYDAERTVASFAGRMRDQVDLPMLTAELRAATTRAVEPATTEVWLRAGVAR